MYKYKYDVNEVGKRIQKIRKKSGMSQERLATELDLTAESISNFENGKTTCMPDHITKICQIFNVSAGYFYFEIERDLEMRNDSGIEKISNMLSSFDDNQIETIRLIFQLILDCSAD